jgi:hypothetical protein
MLSDENLTFLLLRTFRGTSQADILAAEEELRSLGQDDGYPSALFGIVTGASVAFELRVAALTQFRALFCDRPEILQGHGIEYLVAMSKTVPEAFQPVLELLATCITSYYVKSSLHGVLAEAAVRILSSEWPLPGFMILYCLSEDSECEHTLIHAIIEAEMSASLIDQPQIVFRYFARTLRNFILQCLFPSEALSVLLNLSCQFITSFRDLSLCEDFLDLAKTILAIYPESFDIRPFVEACVRFSQLPESHSHMIPLFEGLTSIFSSSSLSQISESLFQILTDVFAPVFFLTPTDLENFANDEDSFISDVFPGRLEPDTVRSAASICLYEGSKNDPRIADLSLDTAFSNMGSLADQNFGWLSFLSASFEFCECHEKLSSFLQILMQLLNSGNPLNLCGSLMLLSNAPYCVVKEGSAFLNIALHVLLENSGSCALEYSACCACGSLMAGVCESLDPSLMEATARAMFMCSGRYKTDTTANSLLTLVSVWPDCCAPLAECFVLSVLELFESYVNDEMADVRRSAVRLSNAVVILCQYVQNFLVIDQILKEIQGYIAKGYCSTFCEEIVPLVGICVKNLTVMTESAFDIPAMLLELYCDEGRMEVKQIASIFKLFAQKFGNQGDIVEKMFLLFQNVFEDDFYDGDDTAIVSLCHTLFVILRQQQLIDVIGDIDGFAEKLNEECLGDVCASLIECAPEIMSQNGRIMQRWMESAGPLSFLSAAIRVLEVAPGLVDSLRPAIQVRVEILREMDIESMAKAVWYDIGEIRRVFMGQSC